MPRIKYTIVADSITQNAAGKISILGIFDVVFANSVPSTTSFDFVACFESDGTNEAQNYGIRVWNEIPDEGRAIVVDDPTGINFPEKSADKGKIHHSCIFQVENLPISDFGILSITVELMEEESQGRKDLAKRKVLDTQTLDIRVVPFPESTSATSA